MHDLLGSITVLLPPTRPWRHRPAGGDRVVELIHGLVAERVQANLARVRERIAATGRDPETVEILAAVKYVPVDELGVLADAGLTLVGENRAQDLVAKAEAYPGRFTWDFIGHLQSRKVRQVLPYVRYIHSVASDSVLAQLERHGRPETEILVEVNVSGEPEKSGIAPGVLEAFLRRCPVTVVGLMTMPPLAEQPEDSRPYFAALRDARGPLRAAASVDGDDPGLRRRRRGRRHDCAAWYDVVRWLMFHRRPARHNHGRESALMRETHPRSWPFAIPGTARSSTSDSPKMTRTTRKWSPTRSRSRRPRSPTASGRRSVVSARGGAGMRSTTSLPTMSVPSGARARCGRSRAPGATAGAAAAMSACTSSRRRASTTCRTSRTNSRTRSRSSSTFRAPTPICQSA